MKIGDRVKIREWDDMEKEFGLNALGDINCNRFFTKSMCYLCGTTHTVKEVDETGDTTVVDVWHISDDMVEIIAGPSLSDSKDYDPVSKPSHYCEGGNMECIDEMELIFGSEAVMHFCLLNAWKYRRRAMYKNGQQDMDKAAWYLDKYKELKEKENA